MMLVVVDFYVVFFLPETFDRISAGDCIVCFSKNDIYTITRQLEKRGIEFAVIYGTLPPGFVFSFLKSHLPNVIFVRCVVTFNQLC